MGSLTRLAVFVGFVWALAGPFKILGSSTAQALLDGQALADALGNGSQVNLKLFSINFAFQSSHFPPIHMQITLAMTTGSLLANVLDFGHHILVTITQ